MILLKNKPKRQQYFFPEECSLSTFVRALKQEVVRKKSAFDCPVILCIGTDSITGDCLGPLAGTKLQERNYSLPVYGTLQYPVHAANLLQVTEKIRSNFQNPFLIVIDAAVGSSESVGYVSLSPSPLYPGKGIERPLPPIGHLSLTGVVCDASFAAEQLLPYIRLHMVNQMADFIAKGIMEMEQEII